VGYRTDISWTDSTWNPVVGCSIVSPGCTNCYAMKLAGRLERMGSPIYKGHTMPSKAGVVWNGHVDQSNWGQVIKPLSWKRPRRIFVNSMSDLFHENLPDRIRDIVFAVMANCPQHTFQVLTKRADVMRRYMSDQNRLDAIYTQWPSVSGSAREVDAWPLPNVHIGVSVEDQRRANERIPSLLATPAASRFLSCEPLLGSLDLNWLGLPGLDWIICGGESGTGARLMMRHWAENLQRQCGAAGVPFFMKQIGSCHEGWGKITGKGHDPAEWPPELRVQEFPA
jgi:protein gp37